MAQRLANETRAESMTAKRILIVTASHLCRNPRVVKEATALGHAGYDVTVLTLSTNSRFEKMDRELLVGQPFTREAIDYTTHGLRTRLSSFRDRGSTWLARRVQQHFGIEWRSALGPSRPLLNRTLATSVDLTILHTELPLTFAPVLSRQGRSWAADLEDWYSEDLLERDRVGRPIKLLRRAERFALTHAAYCTTTSHSMAAALGTAFDCSLPRVLRNTFPLPAAFASQAARSSAPPALVWFSQTIGPGRGLEVFLTVWNRTIAPSRVVLLGDTSEHYRTQLLGCVAPEKRPYLEFHPFVRPEQLPTVLAAFDLGLALEPSEPRNKDLTISNKLFQYLGAGLGVIATRTAGQQEILAAAPGAGVFFEGAQPDRMATTLDELLANREQLRSMQTLARRSAEDQFCWEKESRHLLDAVDSALSAAKTP
jgi:glycosyltransferase involved in cell wall biosynthesis